MAQHRMVIIKLKYLIERFFLALKNNSIKVVLKKIYNTLFGSNKIDLDKLNIDKNLELDDILLKFGTAKGSLVGKWTYDFLERDKRGGKFKNYYDWINRENPRSFEYQRGANFTPYYEKYLGQLRHKSLKILETGVVNGHFSASLYNYLPNSIIYAADYVGLYSFIKKNHSFFYKGKRLKFYSLNLMDDKAVNKFTKNNKFDIIFEDTLYDQTFQTTNIKNLYPALNRGGIYIFENFVRYDRIIDTTKKINENLGKKIMTKRPYTTHEILSFIKNKKMFEHGILKEDVLKYIFDTTDNVEIHYGSDPCCSIAQDLVVKEISPYFYSLGILFKKY